MFENIVQVFSNILQKIKADKEVDKALSSLISNDLLPHTCQIFVKDIENGMKPFASGVLAELSGSFYLLTASHVTEHFVEDKQLFLRIRTGYVSIVGDLRETDIAESDGIDLAYIQLDERIIPDLLKGYKFLPLSKFRRHLKLLDAMQYCIIGFPEKNQRKLNGKLQTGASVFFVQPSKKNVYEYYGFNEASSFIMEFKGKGTDIKTGKEKKIKGDFYGISGCGLWLVILESDRSVQNK